MIEDINRDNTMNTIDSYFEYEMDITPSSLADLNNGFIVDRKEDNVTLPNGDNATTKWYQFRIPLTEPSNQVGGITDFRSIRFTRLYLKEFTQNTILRFASLDLVRSDWRRYKLALDEEVNNDNDNTDFSVENFALEIGMSRSSLFLKLKSITGQSTSEFIRTNRLNKAAKLIESGKYSITEIIYMVGFSDPKYFRTCFKKHFDCTPSSYLSNFKTVAS